MAKVIVLGAGIGGISAAYELRSLMGEKAEVTVVSDSEWFQFVPSNPWVALSWRKPGDIKIHLPEVLAKFGIAFEAAGAKHVLPAENTVELKNGKRLIYDYLVIATGPALAFDEVEGLGPAANSISICHVDHAESAAARWEAFCQDPGPMVIGAVQGASCFGPAYEFALMVNTDLRRRKIRDQVPITFVTAEPYIGHLGLGGVGDTKGLLESVLRDRDIRWVTNAKVDRVATDAVEITEIGEDGRAKTQRRIPSKLTMFIPAFRGVSCLMGEDGKGLSRPCQSPRFSAHRQISAESNVQERFCRRRLRCHSTLRADTGARRCAQDRLHDRVNGFGCGRKYWRHDRRPRAAARGDLECGVPCRLRQ
jgi:sulfide:quinone oxidoreductase